MSQTTAIIIAVLLYVVLPIILLAVGYMVYKKLTKPKLLEYTAIPKLGYIPQTSLPVDIKTTLETLNDKGSKLRMLYGDTNKDGVIDDKDAINETYVMINKLLDEHIPQAIMDYRSLNDLSNNRVENVTIANSNVTGKQALMDILNTINSQFDELIDASYHKDAQKLLITNRYLQKRFDSHEV